MATIDEIVAGLIDFRNTTYTRLDAIDASLATILGRGSMKILCPSCDGTGKRMRSVDHGDGGMGPDLEEFDCPKCNGGCTKVFGTLET